MWCHYSSLVWVGVMTLTPRPSNLAVWSLTTWYFSCAEWKIRMTRCRHCKGTTMWWETSNFHLVTLWYEFSFGVGFKVSWQFMGDGNCRRQFFLMWNSRIDFMLVWQQRVIVMQNMQECDEWSLHIQVFVFPFFSFSFFPCSRLAHWSCLCQGFGVCVSLDIDDLDSPNTCDQLCLAASKQVQKGLVRVGTNRGGCSVKADERLEMIQLPRFGSRHFSCFASCLQGSKWADVPHFAALCCGYPEVRGGTSGIVKGYLDLQQLRSYGILGPWHFITCLRRSKTPSLLIFQGPWAVWNHWLHLVNVL